MISAAVQSSPQALTAGQTYYFDEGPMHGYFLSQTFHSKPLSVEQAELLSVLRIGVVRPDQKIDHETTYQRKRENFPLDAQKFSSVPDGTSYYKKEEAFALTPITIEVALQSETYVKVVKERGEIVRSELVTTPSVNTKRYTYWPNGNFKNSSGYNENQNQRTPFSLDFDEKTGEPK